MAQATHIATGQSALAGSGITVASGGQATFSLDVTAFKNGAVLDEGDFWTFVAVQGLQPVADAVALRK